MSNTLDGIGKVEYAPNYGEKSNFEDSKTWSGEDNHSKFCWHRLPCGICTKTNSMCPLFKGQAELEITCKE